MRLDISKIKPSSWQLRKRLDRLEELSASIKDKGLLEPIMVRPIDGGLYEIIHGGRRYRASVMAGLDTIEAIVREAGEKEAYELGLIENLQREDLSPMEEAAAYAEMQCQGYKQEDIAAIIGRTQSYVAHKLRLLKMPEPLTFYLEQNVLTENHLRQIARLEGVYGDDLLRGLPDDIDLTGKIDDAEDAALLLVNIRPEERVLLVKPEEEDTVVIDACKPFAEYVSKHKSNTLQWVVAGFWWASMAVVLKLTVADLALAIARWAERYEAALFAWFIEYKPSPMPKDKESAKLYWGYYADLRHSGSLRANETRRWKDLDWRRRQVKKIIHGGGTLYPSEMQGE